MKLIIVTAIREFESDVFRFFKKAGISTFSEVDLSGHKSVLPNQIASNWFAFRSEEYDSFMVFAFTQEVNARQLLDHIQSFNDLI